MIAIENDINCGGLDNMTEGVCIIKTRELSGASCNKMGFEMVNGATKKVFSPKNPFGTYNIFVGRMWN